MNENVHYQREATTNLIGKSKTIVRKSFYFNSMKFECKCEIIGSQTFSTTFLLNFECILRRNNIESNVHQRIDLLVKVVKSLH